MGTYKISIGASFSFSSFRIGPASTAELSATPPASSLTVR